MLPKKSLSKSVMVINKSANKRNLNKSSMFDANNETKKNESNKS